MEPPKLVRNETGGIEENSFADLLEFFLNYDQRVAIVRHPNVEELFQWKQFDDESRGIEPAPFDSAESRFAIGIFHAVAENDTEEKLARWITDVLGALGRAKGNNEDVAKKVQLLTGTISRHGSREDSY